MFNCAVLESRDPIVFDADDTDIYRLNVCLIDWSGSCICMNQSNW